VVGGADMTTEAAVAQLYYLLGSGLGADEVRRRVQEDLRGELTVSGTSS
jgi:L-asparaginase